VWLAVAACLGFVILAIQDDPDVQFGLDEQAKPSLALVPGVIRIKLWSQAPTLQFRIERGVLTPLETMAQPPMEADEIIFDTSDVASRWPRTGRFYYEGHYRTSPDGSRLSASIVHKQPYEPSPTSFVIVDLSRMAITAEVADESHRLIDRFAWSADSQMVAVLEYTEESHFRLKNIPSNMAGHPIRYVSYYLAVYDRAGRKLASSRLATNLVGSGGQIT
jgi:hypothetical protein